MAEVDKVQHVKNTLKNMKEIRAPREGVWNDIIDYILPGLESVDIVKQDTRGKRIGSKRYDGSGVSALQLFADGLFGYLVSPSIDWLRLKTSQEELMDNADVRLWLQQVERHFYNLFQRTNFYESISTFFEYAPAFGFAALYSEEDDEKGQIVFHVFHPGEMFISEDKYGRVDTIYRECRIPAGTAVDMFGEKNVSDLLLRTAKENEFKKFEFVHAVYPRKDRYPQKKDAQNMPFASVWIESDSNSIVRESGYKQNPYHVWRFKKGTTAYGRGPGEDALIEVMGSNEISKSLLKAAELSVEPPLNVPSELEDKVDITPSGFNFYSDPQKVVTPVNTGINFPVGIDREEKIQQAIERHFKVEFFTLLSQYEGSSRTATEIIELQGEKAAVLGRPVNRLNTETLEPIIDRVFDMEFAAGRLPPPPPELSGARLEVDFRGPLAQAQKKLFEVQGLSHGLAQIAPVLEIKPEVEDIVDWDEVGRRILRANNFPVEAVQDKDIVKAIREARMRVQQQEAMQEDIEKAANTTETFAKADKATGNKLSKALEEAAG